MWLFLGLAILCTLVNAQNEFIPTNYEEVSSSTMPSFGAIEKCGEGAQEGRSLCVPYHRCDPKTEMIKPEEDESEEEIQDYSLLIDIRFGETKKCPQFLDVCCQIGNDTKPPPTPPVVPTPSPDPKPGRLNFCGIRNINGIGFKITGNTHNEAEYGEFPWMLAILKADYNPSVDPTLAVCGGSLIAPRVVLTGAHCAHKYQENGLKVRAGEWDTQTTDEKYKYQERNVAEIIIHEDFQDGILINDVALLILETPFAKARHIGTICLPEQDEKIISNECYATGWGKNLFGREGEYQVILKKIELPIVPHKQCQEALRKTRLGSTFRLHKSFTCAGGVEGKDTCTGDGGSPLVCPDPKNPSRYVQAGIVAWGIGCGTTAPGVYADVAKFRSWIDKHMQRLNLSQKPYIE